MPLYAGLRIVLPPAEITDVWWRWVLTLALSGTALALIVFTLALLQRRLGLTAAPVAAMAAGTGTPLLVYASFLYSHELAALFLLLLVITALAAPGRPLIGGLLFGALCSTEYLAAIGGLVPFGVVLAWTWRSNGALALLRPLAGAALGALPLAAYLWIAFGSPVANMYTLLATPEFRAGYEAGAIGLPRPDVALALLVSGHRGLFVFAPLVIVGLWAMRSLWTVRPATRPLIALSAASALLIFLTTSGYVFWYGGSSYGPRYLVPLLPLLLWPIALVPTRPLALAAAAASLPQLLALSVAEPLLGVAHTFPYFDYLERSFYWLAPAWPTFLLGLTPHHGLVLAVVLMLAPYLVSGAPRS